MQQLNNTDFMCDKCSATFKYEARHKHWESCGAEFKCKIAGCTSADNTFDDNGQLEAHWTQTCNVIDLQCNVCEALVKRPDVETH